MEGKVKVVHIITRLILGGAQENTLLTVEGLKKAGNYDVSLFTGPSLGPEGSLIEEAKRRGIEPVIIEPLRRNIHPWLDFKSFFKLYFLLRKGSYHIVHTHSTKAGILARIAAWNAGVPIIIHTIHGLPFFPYQHKFMNFLAVNLERLAAPCTEKIITVCNTMTKKAHRAKVAPFKKFLTIYSGMELDEFLKVKTNENLKKSLGIKDGDLVVGKIARLFELKGHRFLLKGAKEVISKFPNVKFLFVGDGMLKDELKKQVYELGIEDKVIFTGLVSREKIPEYISTMDIVVHVSLREGLARIIPQAFACGKPVVSFSVDGADEIIEDGRNGFLIPPPDISEEDWRNYDSSKLSSCILKLLQDENLRITMGKEGKKVVDPIFRAEYMVEKIDTLYKKILKEKKIISLD
jgi:glycosyltransferase involved in cell wall biosynthesis